MFCRVLHLLGAEGSLGVCSCPARPFRVKDGTGADTPLPLQRGLMPGCLDAWMHEVGGSIYGPIAPAVTLYVCSSRQGKPSSIPRLTFSSSLHFTFSMVPSKLPYLCTRTFNTAQPCPSTPPVFAPVLPWMQPSIHQHATALGQS